VSDQISVDPAQKWAMAWASDGPFQTVARRAISTKSQAAFDQDRSNRD